MLRPFAPNASQKSPQMKSLIPTLTGVALAALSPGLAFAEDPRPVDLAVAQSKDSRTLDRANPEMRAVIEKLMALGAKPVNTLTVEQARAPAYLPQSTSRLRLTIAGACCSSRTTVDLLPSRGGSGRPLRPKARV